MVTLLLDIVALSISAVSLKPVSEVEVSAGSNTSVESLDCFLSGVSNRERDISSLHAAGAELKTGVINLSIARESDDIAIPFLH
jgi:hypothetical protein